MEKKEHLDHTKHQFRAPDELAARVKLIEQVSPSIKRLTLDILHPSPPPFKAGQWVDFFIPGQPQVGGFSMWNSPGMFSRSGDLELAVKFSTWPPANWIHTKCQEGDQVSVRFGGDFFYPTDDIVTSDNHSLLLIGGGVGINPLLSIWMHARDLWKDDTAENKPQQVHLLFSAVSKEELIFKNMFDCTTKEFPNFTASYFVTRPGPDRTGRFDMSELSLRVSQLKPGRVIVYLCGPPLMNRDAVKMLKELDIPEEDIRYEVWY